MTVRELIAMLTEQPPDLPVVISTGVMQDLMEIGRCEIGPMHDWSVAWSADIVYVSGLWLELM